MRSITSKRVFGVVAAASITAASLVSLAASSEAAVGKYKVNATTSASQLVTVTGTDFQDDNGVALIDTAKVHFTTAACSSALPSTTNYAATAATVISDTKLSVTVDPAALALTGSKPTKYNICIYDTASTQALAGSATTTVYTAPTFTAISSVLSGSALGGTKITVTGQDFTTKSVLSVGGKPVLKGKVTLGKTSSDPDIAVGYTPAGTGATAAIKLEGEAGKTPVTVSSTAQTFAYSNAIAVSPSGSDGTAGRIVTVTGTGFNSLTFSNTLAVSKASVALVKAGTTLTGFYASSAVATPTGSFMCGNITVNSDTELTCTIPTIATASAAGGYTVVLVNYTATGISTIGTTGYSRSAAYTVAAF